MKVVIEQPLLSPRNKKEAEAFSLVNEVLLRKIAVDESLGRNVFDEDDGSGGSIPPDAYDDFIEIITQGARFGFPVITKQLDVFDLDRCSSMISGPLYTSANFPWPDQSRGHVEPLFQIDLEWAGQTGGIDVGDGLVQVWMDNSESKVRHIPRSEVDRDRLTPVPDNLALNIEHNIYSYEAARLQEAVWETSGHQVIGIGAPVLSFHQMIDRLLNDGLADVPDNYDPRLVADGKRARQKMDRIGRSTSSRVSSTDGMLFGNYFPWNWDAGTEHVFMGFDMSETFNFKSEGLGALLFYKGKSDSFWFDWGV